MFNTTSSLSLSLMLRFDWVQPRAPIRAPSLHHPGCWDVVTQLQKKWFLKPLGTFPFLLFCNFSICTTVTGGRVWASKRRRLCLRHQQVFTDVRRQVQYVTEGGSSPGEPRRERSRSHTPDTTSGTDRLTWDMTEAYLSQLFGCGNSRIWFKMWSSLKGEIFTLSCLNTTQTALFSISSLSQFSLELFFLFKLSKMNHRTSKLR